MFLVFFHSPSGGRGKAGQARPMRSAYSRMRCLPFRKPGNLRVTVSLFFSRLCFKNKRPPCRCFCIHGSDFGALLVGLGRCPTAETNSQTGAFLCKTRLCSGPDFHSRSETATVHISLFQNPIGNDWIRHFNTEQKENFVGFSMLVYGEVLFQISTDEKSISSVISSMNFAPSLKLRINDSRCSKATASL